MRNELTTTLTARYPALYGQHFGFEHHGGWFSLIDALSEALVTGAEVAGRPPPRASQVKEKFGTLRWYHGGDAFDDGAIALAEEMSSRVCERTGRPGRLGSRGGWWATRAPGVDGIEPQEVGFQKDGKMGTPRIGCSAKGPSSTCRRGGGTSRTGSCACSGTDRMTGRKCMSTGFASRTAR